VTNPGPNRPVRRRHPHLREGQSGLRQNAWEGKTMSILKNLQRVAAVVAADDLNGGKFGESLKNTAIEAMVTGINSPAGEAYMSMFADNAQQLARLTKPDKANDPDWLPQSRAYIMANSICGTITGTRTQLNVDMRIDLGLSEAPDADDGTRKKRPFPIPTPVIKPEV
jgi:hypothetical protein